ncbi:hypothetical protein C8R43DRAFT_951481 [Mycena crocata]|nr:hypothetical protein C8R43DRAFT_951481 [Mycena crocata]
MSQTGRASPGDFGARNRNQPQCTAFALLCCFTILLAFALSLNSLFAFSWVRAAISVRGRVQPPHSTSATQPFRNGGEGADRSLRKDFWQKRQKRNPLGGSQSEDDSFKKFSGNIWRSGIAVNCSAGLAQ